ncbi:MAG: terpene cyclase/mutase family protein [Pirellulales bacterium]|nr:terpene cyclase/mutase family protein [Pirellulales bacterium]
MSASRPPEGRQPPHGNPPKTAGHPKRSPADRETSAAAGNRSPGEEPLATLLIESSPPWLFSMAFHMLMLIVMGLIVYVNIPSKPIELTAETDWADQEGSQLVFDTPIGEPDVPTTAEHALVTPDNLPLVDSPLAAPGDLELYPEGTMSSSEVQAPQIGMALSGREEGSVKREGLIGRYGGNKATEAAVKKGLAWLARNQLSEGAWSLAGPYGDGVPFEGMDNKASATAMALLAFQGAGHTHRGGSFRSNVMKGWSWLLKQQDSSGSFFQFGMNSHRFYTHAQCAIAVCELYGMTKDEAFKGPAQQAIEYIVKTQSPSGGWRYDPGVDSDVSVTGWVVMALQSARMAGLKVPKDALENVTRYLDDVARSDGARYPYQKNGDIRLSMTAEALLMRQYLGWKRDDPRLAAGVLWITSPENLVDFNRDRNVYYWYYATQVAHHMGGDYWKRWNKVMREVLPKQQVARGHESGSWDPNRPTRDQFSNQGGRLYVTCLSICMLEVYYRHLPIYTDVFRR